MRRAAAVLVLVLSVACTSGDDDGGRSAPTAASMTTPAPTASGLAAPTGAAPAPATPTATASAPESSPSAAPATSPRPTATATPRPAAAALPTPRPTYRPDRRAPHVAAVPTFRSAGELARVLAEASRQIRDARTPPRQVARAAELTQLAYHQLVTEEAWQPKVYATLPAALRGTAKANVQAVQEIRILNKPRPELPEWRIVDPLPAAELMRYYRKAQRATGIHWSYLAAINLVETRMGRIIGLSTAGARGPMQFMPTTWDLVGRGDIDDPHDSIQAAARYLVDRGGPGDMAKAIRGYNNSARYVIAVQNYAAELRRHPRAWLEYYNWRTIFELEPREVLLLEGYQRRPG